VSGRQSAKRRRKRRVAGAAVAESPAETRQAPEPAPGEPKPSRDDVARERLVPLRHGERPAAVTVAAIVAAAIALSNIVGRIAGIEINGKPVPVSAIVAQGALMMTCAIGMWYARYWAVLGFQTLLALFIVIVSLSIIKAESIAGVLLAGGLLLAAGTLFWFLVKAMARIQMPERRPPRADG
jgi:hypothetical protein